MSMKVIGILFKYNARMLKIRIAASFADVALEYADPSCIADLDAFKKNAHPLGASPVLQTEQGYLFESSAIMRYLGRLSKTAIYGTTAFEASEVDSWLDFTSTEIDTAMFSILIASLGYITLTDEQRKGHEEQLHTALAGVDQWLENRTYLVGERITLADMSFFATVDVCQRACTDISKYRNVYRLCMTVLHNSKVQEALHAAGHDGLIPAKAAKTEAKPAKAAKAEEKPAKAKAAKAAKAEAADDDEEEEELAPVEKKKPNPLDTLPVSKFVLDAFKREYSNKDTRKAAAPFFFDNFDAAGFTAFWGNYKYNDELKAQFMTANLLRGWFQRMDHVRKYAFGTALIVGEDKQHEIKTFWVFRGKGLPEIVRDVDDTELFEWVEIADINAEKDKITDFLAWDGATFAKTEVLEGRTYK